MKIIFSHSKKRNRRYKLFPYNGNDNIPFGLCNACKALGYCRRRKEYEESKIRAEIESAVSVKKFDIKEYFWQVPLQIMGSRFGRFSTFHLQTACDAFHQEDYETAILHFRATIEGAGNFDEAFIGLAVSYFMIKDYENAALFMYRCQSMFYYSTYEMADNFFAEIDRLTIKNDKIEKVVVGEKERTVEKSIRTKEYILQEA